MRININIVKRFHTRFYSVTQKRNQKMEEIIKDIFYASVNSVKPCELITKNKLVNILVSKNNKEFIEIRNKTNFKRFDVTDKKIHLGELVHANIF